MSRRLSQLLGVVLLSAALSGCGSQEGQRLGAPVAGDGSYDYDRWGMSDNALPSATLEDWVSYADQVSAVTVVAEHQLPLGPDELANAEGSVARTVTLEIERTLWRRPGAPRAQRRVTFDTWGWRLHEGRMTPMNQGGARLEVGRRYVLPLVLFTFEGEEGWGVLADGDANFPLGGSTIVDGQVERPAKPGSDPYPGLEVFTGVTLDAFAARLARTKADPLAAKYADLDPLARWEAVARGCGEC